MSRTYRLLEAVFSAIDPRKLFFTHMRQAAPGKKIIFSESLIQCQQFLFLAKLVIGCYRTQNQEKLRPK